MKAPRWLRLTILALTCVLVTAGAAAANDYEPSQPTSIDQGCINCPQLKVSPADGIVNGQTVQVTGKRYGLDASLMNPDGTIQGGTGGVIRECNAALTLCDSTTVSFTTGRNGEFNPLDHPNNPNDPETVPVPFTAKSSFVANGTTVDCLQTQCVIFALRHSTDIPYEDKIATHHLSFLPVGRYNPLVPARILDTRVGIGGISSPIGPAASVDVQVSGQGGVPASGVAAVVMNVTVTEPTGNGFLTLSPTGTPRPNASNLNFTAGETIPNLVVVKLGTSGRVNLFNSAGSTHVIFDVAGWYSDTTAGSDGRYQPLVPARILDTRVGPGAGLTLGPGASLDLQVTGAGGVPASGAEAVVLNVAATNTTAPSYLTIFPTGQVRPNASNLNWNAGDTVSNRVMVRLGTAGKVTIYNNAGSTDVVVDVGGWVTDATQTANFGGNYTALAPARILDTRVGIGGFTQPVSAGTAIDVQVVGQGLVPPAGVSAVVLNVTVTSPSGPGFLTIFPSDATQPLASDLNFGPNETRPNLVVVRLSPQYRFGSATTPYAITGGKVKVYSSQTSHVIIDVAGWYSNVTFAP